MWINIPEKDAHELSANLKKAGFADLATKVRSAIATDTNTETAAYIQEAKDLYEDNDCDIEVDEHAVISKGDIGAFVMAWVFVRYAEAGLDL